MTRKEMVKYWNWLIRQGDNEAAKEVEYSFFDLWGESIFDYIWKEQISCLHCWRFSERLLCSACSFS
jgi:hypothetical protein